MNLTIQNQATKNVAVLGYVALYLCLDRHPRGSRCAVQGLIGCVRLTDDHWWVWVSIEAATT